MTANEQLKNLYQKLFAQKAVLTKAPPLTLDVTNISPNDFPTEQALQEVKQIISYLLGIKDVDTITPEHALSICQKAYAEQPFWKEVILDFLSYQNQMEELSLQAESQKLSQDGQAILERIQRLETENQTEVQSYAEQIEAAGFPIDARKLIQNYLNMAAYDPTKAYAELIQNPAYFSPLKTHDKDGKELLSPSQARAENKRLGQFLTKLIA